MMKKIIFYAFIFILFMGCSIHNASTRGRLVSNHDAYDTIARAQSFYDAGEIDAALILLRNLVDRKSYHASHDKAYELIVEWLLQTNRRDDAKRVASYFLDHHENSGSAQKIIKLFEHSLNGEQTPLPVDRSSKEIMAESHDLEVLEDIPLREDEINAITQKH